MEPRPPPPPDGPGDPDPAAAAARQAAPPVDPQIAPPRAPQGAPPVGIGGAEPILPRPQRRRRRLRRIALFVAVAAAGLVAPGPPEIPSRYAVWKPLSLDDPVNFVTRLKLERLARDAAACRATLARAGAIFEPLPDRPMVGGCGLTDAVGVVRIGRAIEGRFPLTCKAAVALALFERQVVQPAAARHYGTAVATIESFGTYSCRDIVSHRPSRGRRSEHATANAIDLSAFVLAGGERISLTQNWAGRDYRAQAFLREIHHGACGIFNVTLGPDYNVFHHDHFHLDMGPMRSCR